MPMFDSIRELWSQGSNAARNATQAIPGGAHVFPMEDNGTINWLGNPVRGDNVLGAVVRGRTGIGAVESAGRIGQGFISNLFRGGTRDPMTHAGLGPTNATPTTGGAGFLQGGFGGGSGRDPNWRSQGVSDWAQGASGAARAATDARNSEIANEARGTNSDINEFREGGGSSQGRSTARVTGGDVSLIEHVRAQFNRGGTQGER